MDSSAAVVLQLIHKAFDSSFQVSFPEGTDWNRALSLAFSQGVCGICMGAIEQIPVGSIPKKPLIQWFGRADLQSKKYQSSWIVACKLDKLWEVEGIHATVLKGRAIAQYYPVPQHRFSCDLDLFIEQDWERACALLEGKGIRLGREVYKEVEFTIDDVYVECHRYITPVRGNKHLQLFERYLRSLLNDGPRTCFEGTTLACPPLMFTVMLYVEHALNDFLRGKLTLKHIVDWVVLRKQALEWSDFASKCKEFKFDRFVALIDALADLVEGKATYESLPSSYRQSFDEFFQESHSARRRTWFQRRKSLFFDILKNGKKFREFGYTSMPSYLFNAIWSHFFDREVRL